MTPALHAPPHGPGRGERPFRQGREDRRPRGDGHVLSAGLQPDQLAEAREAFNIDAEPAADSRRIRPQRGRPAMLMARRLVAAGVRFVSLTYGGWDMHTQITPGHAEPDAAVRPGVRRADPRPGPQRAAQRDAGHGFQRVRPHAQDQQGRRPRSLAQGLQRRAGRRRHQGRARSTGLSNATAAEPDRDAIGPADLATTVYHQLGIVADKELMAPGNRPIEIVDGGKVRSELLA